MRFKSPKPPPLDHARAAAIAAAALAFLTGEPARLARFLDETGMAAATLASAVAAGGDGILGACLDHIVADESLLLVFAADQRRKPEEIVLAQHLLQGPSPDTCG